MLRIARRELLDALRDVQGAIARDKSFPGGQTVVITAPQLRVASASMIAVRTFEATEELEPEEQHLVFNHGMLRKIVTATRAEELAIGRVDGQPTLISGSLVVKCPEPVEVQIEHLSREEPQYQDVGDYDLTPLHRVLHAVEKDMARPVLSAVCLSCKDHEENVHAVTADGFRMAVATIEGPKFPNGLQQLLLPHTLIEGIKHRDLSNVHIAHDNRKAVRLTLKNAQYEATTIEGAYPNYETLVPGNAVAVYRFSRAAMRDALLPMMPLRKYAPSGIVRLVFSAHEVQLSVGAWGDMFYATANIPVQHVERDDEARVAVNIKYLYDVLSLGGDDETVIAIRGTSSPLKLEWEGHIEIVMPMFVQW